MSFVPYLQAAASTSGGFAMSILPFVLIIGIFYFFIIRPQNKKQKETQKMLDTLKKGDKVITIGGIHGVIASVKEKTVIVKVDDNAKIEFNRSAVSGVVSDKPAATPVKGKKADKAEKAAEAAPVAESAETKPAETTEEKK